MLKPHEKGIYSKQEVIFHSRASLAAYGYLGGLLLVGASSLGLGYMLEVRGYNAPAQPAFEPGHAMVSAAPQSVVTPQAIDASLKREKSRLDE